ncbi:MAG: hypothetical protein KAY65_04470 [Planctomycetes bacterium]|nr:hypothetical protein [Planctomycetota bacterium]
MVSEKAPTESEEAERQIATQGESIMQNSDAERTNVDHEEVQPVMVSDGQQVQSNSVVQQTTIEQVGTEESMEDSSSMAVPHAASVAECAAVGQSDTADHVQGEKVECGVAAKNQQNEIDAKEEYKWLALIVLLMIFIIAIGVRFGSPSPIKDTRASVWKRHLSTPSSRLEGYWRGGSETLHYFVDNSLETGTFFLSDTATKLDQRVQFKILSEERSGKKLLVREYWSLDGSHDWVEVEYTISKDGKSLAKEYRQWDGKGWLDVYSYDEKSTKTFEEGFDIWRKRRFVPEPQD